MANRTRTIGSVRSYAVRLRGPVLVLFLAVVALSPIVHTHGIFSSGLDPGQRGGEKQSCPACVFNTNAGPVPDASRLSLSLEALAKVEDRSVSCVPATFSAQTGRSPPAA